jgi:hypothetical protein
MKSVKIDIPKGYEIDKEKSTFENIVFKKVEDVIIEWNDEYGGVEIKAEGEHFVVDAESPSFYCNWKDAMRHYSNRSYYAWKLPTVKQLQVLSKYTDKVNDVIRSNNGFEVDGWMWSCQEENRCCARFVSMYNSYTDYYNKDNCCYVRAVCTL